MEGDGGDGHQEVAGRQGHDEEVGDGAHLAAAREGQDDHRVAQHREHQLQGEQQDQDDGRHVGHLVRWGNKKQAGQVFKIKVMGNQI